MDKIQSWLSVISFLLALFAIGFSFFRCHPIEADWMGILVGILAFITAILLAVQFYNYVFFNKEVEKKIKKAETSIYLRNKEYMEGIANYTEGASIIFNKGVRTEHFGKSYKMIVCALSHFCKYGRESNIFIYKCLDGINYILDSYEEYIKDMETQPYGYTSNQLGSHIKENFNSLDLTNDNDYLKEKVNIINYSKSTKAQSCIELFIKYEKRRQDIVRKYYIMTNKK